MMVMPGITHLTHIRDPACARKPIFLEKYGRWLIRSISVSYLEFGIRLDLFIAGFSRTRLILRTYSTIYGISFVAVV